MDMEQIIQGIYVYISHRTHIFLAQVFRLERVKYRIDRKQFTWIFARISMASCGLRSGARWSDLPARFTTSDCVQLLLPLAG